MPPDDVRGMPSTSADAASSQLEPFWAAAAAAAQPELSRIRHRLPRFSSPPLRIQRVNQLDAELLDAELVSMLIQPVKDALFHIKATLPATVEPELLLALRLALYKFSIVDRGATYGAMLQNLRYRNEWAHRGGLQSTYRDAPLARSQLLLYPLLTIFLPYGHSRLERRMTRLSYSESNANDPRRRLWDLLNVFQRFYAASALVNFAVFLGDGKYRTLTDRLLGMRLTYAQRTINRNVSFEFLNRQLVWHAFTEFLLFLLPLVRPRRLLRRLARIPTHPLTLGLAYQLLPRFITSRAGLVQNDMGLTELSHTSPIRRIARSLRGKKTDGDKIEGRYSHLPVYVCAICFERAEKTAGAASTGAAMLAVGIPSSDPLDPSSHTFAPDHARASDSSMPGSAVEPPATRKHLANTALSDTLNGIALADALIHTPYAARPCGCEYCYVCLAAALLNEDAADALAEEGGWQCLRCGEPVREAVRVEGVETTMDEKQGMVEDGDRAGNGRRALPKDSDANDGRAAHAERLTKKDFSRHTRQ